MNWFGSSLELDEQIWESRSDSKDFLDAELLVTTENHGQDFLLGSGLSPKKRYIARVQFVVKGIFANALKLLLALDDRNEGLPLECLHLQKFVNGRDTNGLARLFAPAFSLNHPCILATRNLTCLLWKLPKS